MHNVFVDAKVTVNYTTSSVVDQTHKKGWFRIKVQNEAEDAEFIGIGLNSNLHISQTLNNLKVVEEFTSTNFIIIFYVTCQNHGSLVGARAGKLLIRRMLHEYF